MNVVRNMGLIFVIAAPQIQAMELSKQNVALILGGAACAVTVCREVSDFLKPKPVKNPRDDISFLLFAQQEGFVTSKMLEKMLDEKLRKLLSIDDFKSEVDDYYDKIPASKQFVSDRIKGFTKAVSESFVLKDDLTPDNYKWIATKDYVVQRCLLLMDAKFGELKIEEQIDVITKALDLLLQGNSEGAQAELQKVVKRAGQEQESKATYKLKYRFSQEDWNTLNYYSSEAQYAEELEKHRVVDQQQESGDSEPFPMKQTTAQYMAQFSLKHPKDPEYDLSDDTKNFHLQKVSSEEFARLKEGLEKKKQENSGKELESGDDDMPDLVDGPSD